MMRKFLSETNLAVANIFDLEDGVDQGLSEAINIKNAKLAQIIKDLRAAIDSGDRAAEAKLNTEMRKEMAALAKPVMADFSKAFASFLKEQEKMLSDKYGVEFEFFRDGKPSIGFGTSSYQNSAKAGFSVTLAVNPPDVDAKPSKEKSPKADKFVKHGFDLTTFDNAKNFLKLLKMLGMEEMPTQNDEGYFVWKGPGITIVTGNDPITGTYYKPNSRAPEEGYASYIGLEGDAAKVKKAADYIRKFDPKDESPGKRSFI